MFGKTADKSVDMDDLPPSRMSSRLSSKSSSKPSSRVSSRLSSKPSPGPQSKPLSKPSRSLSSRLSSAEPREPKQTNLNAQTPTGKVSLKVRGRNTPEDDLELSSLSDLSSDDEPKARKKEKCQSPEASMPLDGIPESKDRWPVRRNALQKGTLYYALKRYRPEDPTCELVVQHAVRIIDLILESRDRSRNKLCSNVKVLWLGERMVEILNQPDDFGSLRGVRSRWLLALRQLTLQRRTGEAARLMQHMLTKGMFFSNSLLWRIGFHLLSRVSEGQSEAARERRMPQLRAARLDVFMKQMCRSERSLIDRENLILEYVLHCLADQDLERAVKVMQFVRKDAQPSQAGLRKEKEATRVYHLRQCYLGLAQAGIWSQRIDEAKRINAADGDDVLFEAERAADRSLGYFKLSLPPLIELGEVIDVFLEAYIEIALATSCEDDVEALLRSYVDKKGSPNAPRFLARWLDSRQDSAEMPTLMLATVRAAPNDWSLVSDFVKRFPSHSACLDLLFNFLDHPAAALSHPAAWEMLEDFLRNQGDQGHWSQRQRLWDGVYFRPDVLKEHPHLKEAARLLHGGCDEAAVKGKEATEMLQGCEAATSSKAAESCNQAVENSSETAESCNDVADNSSETAESCNEVPESCSEAVESYDKAKKDIIEVLKKDGPWEEKNQKRRKRQRNCEEEDTKVWKRPKLSLQSRAKSKRPVQQ